MKWRSMVMAVRLLWLWLGLMGSAQVFPSPQAETPEDIKFHAGMAPKGSREVYIPVK